MSRYTHQIIEIKVDGQWKYVPVHKVIDDHHNVLSKCGFIRDMFGGDWCDSKKYYHSGVPQDISKQAREAFIYGDDDYVQCHPVWIDQKGYESLIEHVESELKNALDKLTNAKKESSIEQRLSQIEAKLNGTPVNEKEESEYDCIDDYTEEYNDLLWTLILANSNLTEIQTLAEYQSDKFEDLRIIMYTC